MYTKAWESHSFCQLRALFHLVCLYIHPCYSSYHEPFEEKDGDGAGRVLGRGGASFILQDVQRLREKAVRKDSNIDNLLFFILRAAKLSLAHSLKVHLWEEQVPGMQLRIFLGSRVC